VDAEQLERIRSLVIPPGWRDVQIASSPRTKIQATGRDAAGRRQYIYHPDFRAAQEQAKYDRLLLFGTRLPGLRGRIAADLEVGPYERDWACAAAVALINRAWFRVGGERYARTSRTYGVTTLMKRHATVRGQRVKFHFRAKHRVLVRTTLVDPLLADAVQALLAYPGGSRLFRFDRGGKPMSVNASILNAYIREHLGSEFSAKDFRTWGGTLTAAAALAEHGPPQSSSDERRTLAAVMRRVGNELGNTPSVARSSYVSPAVIEQWRDGRTLDQYAKSMPDGASSTRFLLPTEEALLSLLRSWRVRHSRAA
jgi:DNA topoisomerase I